MRMQEAAWAEQARHRQVAAAEKSAQIEKQQWLRAEMREREKQEMHNKRMEKERTFEQVKDKQAEELAHKQEERFQERLRAHNNVQRMHFVQLEKQNEYNRRHQQITEKVNRALWLKEQQLEAKRAQREKRTREKEELRAKNVQHDYHRRDQFAQTWHEKEAKYHERVIGECDRARANQHKRARDIIEQKDQRNVKQEQFKAMQREETERLVA